MALSVTNKPKAIDQNSLCRLEEANPVVLAILIDSTDSIPERSALKAKKLIDARIASLPANSRIELFEISGSRRSFVDPILSICKPVDGSTANALVENPEQLKKIFTDSFVAPFYARIDELLNSDASDSSPIIEAIDGAIIETFVGTSEASKKEMIVISDLLQHSDLYSFYQAKPSYKEFQSRLISSGQGNIDAGTAKVEFFVVPRKMPLGSRSDLLKFWADFLVSHNAGLGSSMEQL